MPVMLRRPIALALLLLLVMGSGSFAAIDLRLKAQALTALHELNLTHEQLSSLKSLAADTAGKAPSAPRLGPKLKKTLTDLCDALAKDDEEQIADLQEKVDRLEEDNNLDEAGVDPTDAAKKKAPDALKLLTAGEITNLISLHSDEIAGPDRVLIDALDEARSQSDHDFADFRDDVADDVSTLANGYEKDSSKLAKQVSGFLDRVKKLSDEEFKSKRKDLEEEARKIAGSHEAFTVIRHWAEREIAELISNPELPAAIEARLSAEPAKETNP